MVLLVELRERHCSVPRIRISLVPLCICNRINPWVHHLKKHWWHRGQLKHHDVLIGESRRLIKSPQYLHGSKRMNMVIRVALDSEADGRANG